MISLVIGLGNPGPDYVGTRHNVGFDVLDRLAVSLKAVAKPTCPEYDWATAEIDDRQIILARPKTFMNRSGLAVSLLLDRYELLPSEMLVVGDDFALPLGALRFRQGGSDGGHNGLNSIIEAVDTEEFPRLRLGIGPVTENVETADFVLSRFESGQLDTVRTMLDTATEAARFAIDHRLEETMSKYNSTPALPAADD